MKKKRTLSYYAYGGEQSGDPKKAKQVDKAPGDFVQSSYKDPTDPTKIFWERKTSAGGGGGTTTVRRPLTNTNTTRKPGRAVRTITPGGGSGRVDNTEYVYTVTKPQTAPVIPEAKVTPARAWKGQNTFAPRGLSSYAIGQVMVPDRKSNNQYQGGMLDTGTQDVQFQYYKPNTSDLSGEILNIPSAEWNNRQGVNPTTNNVTEDFLNKYRTTKPGMGTGGVAEPGSRTAMGLGVATSVLGALPSLIDAFDVPSGYSNQPLINAATMRNMATPYSGMAFGGTIEDLDEDEIAQVQQYAEENGITPEEAFEQMSGEGQEGYAMGGLTSSKAKKILRDGTAQGHPLTPKQKRYMGWVAGGKKAYGGGADVNVEGGEILQPPGQEPVEMSGPKHEQGGIDVNVPVGTKVFSERLSVDGKTMKQRKEQRERRFAKMDKLMNDGRRSPFTKNTVSRTMQTMGEEEQQDMVLQKVANKIYSPPEQAGYGGYGGNSDWIDPGSWQSWARNAANNPGSTGIYPNDLNMSGFTNFGGVQDYGKPLPKPDYSTVPTQSSNPYPNAPLYASTSPGMFQEGRITNGGYTGTSEGTYQQNPVFPSVTPENGNNSGFMDDIKNMTPGDIIGSAGTLFGAIAPLINSRNAAKNTKPVINRWQGSGQRAIDSNQKAMDLMGTLRSEGMTDLATSAGSAINRNRGGASSINTLRAMDTATQIGKDKASQGINNTYAQQMMALYGQRGGLTNQQDVWEAQGQTAADQATQQNLDAMYSNKGSDLMNFGEGIQRMGQGLNVSHSNRMDMNLLNQMGEFLGFDKTMWLKNLKDLKSKSGGV